MRKVSKFLCGFIIGCMLMTFTTVFADSYKQSIEVKFDTVKVQIDGKDLRASNILYNGTTYLPIRAVVEALKKDIVWDAVTMTANIVEKGHVEDMDARKYEIDGYEFLEMNGDLYYQPPYITSLIKNDYDRYLWEVNEGNSTLDLIQNEKVLVESIPYVKYRYTLFISKSDYENMIAPLFK